MAVRKKKYTPPARLRDKHYSQTGKTKSLKDDNRRSAKEPGWRQSAKGNWYFENRRDRSDNGRELERLYKDMQKSADIIEVYHPKRWGAFYHAFERFNKYNVRRWRDLNTGKLWMPSELTQLMISAKNAGGFARIFRKRKR